MAGVLNDHQRVNEALEVEVLRRPLRGREATLRELDVERLRRRFLARQATIGIVGLGYVGLPLLKAVAEAGFQGVGLDIDRSKVRKLQIGRSYIRGISDEAIGRLRTTGRFEATSDFSRLAEVDTILICVPTPLTRHREPDLGFIVNTAESIAPHLRRGQLVVLESTTYPGTTSEIVKPVLERSGLCADADFFLAYSPEREDPGNLDFTTTQIPKVVGADTPATLGLACMFYEQLVPQTVPVSSMAVAEAVKLTENVFRSVNIALVNELKIIYGAMGIDVWEVIEAAKTKPFGYTAFYPGPGLGGHCIPIDPFYLTWKAREYDVPTRFIELAGEINTAMPGHVVEQLSRALDQRLGKGLKGARLLIIGLAYKKNVDDTRESPALTIMELLHRRGANFSYHDPHVPLVPETRAHPHLAGLRSVALEPPVVGTYDAVLIVTDHDAVDYEMLVAAAALVIDTRNATKHVQANRSKILRV
jgi:UDP-N-acetyl-D-glucosamine dehydrogenase